MYCELSDTVVAHPKTCRAARLLGVSRPAVIGHLASLWLWATHYAPSGDLTRFDAADIAEAAGYEGDPDQFLQALTSCGPGGSAGYIDQDGGRVTLHDWMDHTGRTLANRVADAERKRQARRTVTPPAPPAVAVAHDPSDRPEPSEPPAPPVPPAPKRTRKPAEPFAAPTPNEVAAHMLEINAGRFTRDRLKRERDKFIRHYVEHDWMVGSRRMRDWKITVRNWMERAENEPDRSAPAPPPSYDASAEHFRELLEGAANG